MLKVELNGNEGIVKVEACGSLPELMADVTTMLNVMYDGIKEEQKKDFKECVKRLAEEELYAKSKEEMDKLANEQKNKVKEKIKKELEDFLKNLFGDK
jgi:predicted RNA-binding protein Jag